MYYIAYSIAIRNVGFLVREAFVSNPTEIFGNYLKRILEDEKCISKSDLAKYAGVSRSQLDDWINGRSPRLDSVDRIAKALRTSAAEILRGEAPSIDPLLARFLAAWNALDDKESWLLLIKSAEALAKLKRGHQSANPPAKHKKTNS